MRSAVSERIERVSAVEVATADRATVETVLCDVARIDAWSECVKVTCARRLGEVGGPFSEQTIATATRQPVTAASRIVERAATLEAVPVFETALGAGEVSVAHVDALTRAFGRLEGDERQQLIDEA